MDKDGLVMVDDLPTVRVVRCDVFLSQFDIYNDILT